MRAEETLMDELEASITKTLTDARHKMYQRMSQEKPSNEGSQLKYMLRYYDKKDSLKTKILKPVDGISIVEAAKQFIGKTESNDQNTYWIYDGKFNLIFAVIN